MARKNSQHILLDILLEKNIAKMNPFKKVNQIRLNKTDIFRLGILTYEPPKRLKETDYFDWQQSKIPALQGMCEDYIFLKPSTIVTDAIGESAVKISEIIGVGVGLTYACKLLNIPANRIQKIPSSKKIKTLDFKVTKSGIEYEVETRSTSYETNVEPMMREVLKKKLGKSGPTIRFGAVVLSRKTNETGKSYILVGDDNDFNKKFDDHLTAQQFLKFYLPVISMILDSVYYNKLSKKAKESALPRDTIPLDRIPKRFEFEGTTYLGEAFDRRLVIENVRRHVASAKSPEELLRHVTNSVGYHQTFIGIDQDLLRRFNNADENQISEYIGKVFSVTTGGATLSSIGDGVITIEYANDSHADYKKLLPREEVKTRIRNYASYISHTGAPECGQPCRSREKLGKPCAIRTYRSACRYHR